MFVFLLFLYISFLSDPTDVLKKVPSNLEVQKLLNDLRANWNMIGIALEIDPGTLESIDHSQKSDDLKLAKVIETWIKNDKPSVTWETLINVIKEPPINHNKKAKEIRDYLGLPH